MSEQATRIQDFLRRSGAVNITIEHGSKHPRIVFEWRSVRQFYVIPGTTGDSLRGYKSAISDLRHILGIVKQEKRVGVRRSVRRPKKSGALTECPMITALPDWRADLLSTRQAPGELSALADMAWKQFWRDCMSKVGGWSYL